MMIIEIKCHDEQSRVVLIYRLPATFIIMFSFHREGSPTLPAMRHLVCPYSSHKYLFPYSAQDVGRIHPTKNKLYFSPYSPQNVVRIHPTAYKNGYCYSQIEKCKILNIFFFKQSLSIYSSAMYLYYQVCSIYAPLFSPIQMVV